MAIMCPSIPKEYNPYSREGEIFDILSKLPESYYVFHSMTVLNNNGGDIIEHEGDFVIFERTKGILCIEAKAGRVYVKDGNWYYSDGRLMNHGSPFRQASVFMHTLMEKVKNTFGEAALKKCKFLNAVWFPSIDKKYFDGKPLTPDGSKDLMIFRDDADNITEVIERIFSENLTWASTNLNSYDSQKWLDRILAPSFNVISLAQMKKDSREYIFGKMLKEQVALLNYLEDQDRAVINGIAGSGKTLMAVEKAKRHSLCGEKVLFLCYNKYLMQHLRSTYELENVDFYTIDGLACKLCNTPTADLDLLAAKLGEMYDSKSFPYKHVIIDEGQDFGQDRIEEADIISTLQLLVLDNDFNEGTFYLFYDKNQQIQSDKVPEYIAEAECKLTLYTNCRNTSRIASTSSRMLVRKNNPKKKKTMTQKILKDHVGGTIPQMYFSCDEKEQIAVINSLIDQFREDGIDNIVILTCSTEKNSVLSHHIEAERYSYKKKDYLFTTCRKFKGLESDAVILTDVDKSCFEEKGEKIAYVGSSRARFKLAVIAKLSDEDCTEIISDMDVQTSGRNPKKDLATILDSKYCKCKTEQLTV